jgi:hypothetical protein
VYVKTLYADLEPFRSAGTVYTVHNLGYQGLFWNHDLPLTGLGWDLFTPRGLEFYGKLNLMKGGLVFADILSPVSETSAGDPEEGSGTARGVSTSAGRISRHRQKGSITRSGTPRPTGTSRRTTPPPDLSARRSAAGTFSRVRPSRGEERWSEYRAADVQKGFDLIERPGTGWHSQPQRW